MTSSTNPLSIRTRGSGSLPSGSSSGSHSYSSMDSTPPMFGSNYHPNSINTTSQRTPIRPAHPGSATSSDTESSFVGTPFAFALERPYEYPFPSPATESCPNLSTSTSISLGLPHIPQPCLTHLSSPVKEHMPLPSVLPPPLLPGESIQGHGVIPSHTPSRPVEGRTARMPLFLRRKSHAPPETAAPVPPGLLAKARDMGRRKSISNGTAVRGHGRQLSLTATGSGQ